LTLLIKISGFALRDEHKSCNDQWFNSLYS